MQAHPISKIQKFTDSYSTYAPAIRRAYHQIHEQIIDKYTPELQQKYKYAIPLLLPSICRSILDYGLDSVKEFEKEFNTRLVGLSTQGDYDPLIFPYNHDNKDKQDKYITPLMHAVDHDQLHLIRNLARYKDVMNQKNTLGRTALFHAIYKQNYEIVPFLIDLGADVNIQTDSGMTPLMLACRQEAPDIVRFLIEKGADVNDRNIHNKTALMLATESGNKAIVRILLNNMNPTDIRHDKEVMEDHDNYCRGLIYPYKQEYTREQTEKISAIRKRMEDILTRVIKPFLNEQKERVQMEENDRREQQLIISHDVGVGWMVQMVQMLLLL